MGTWAGFILLTKPAVLSMADWQTVLVALWKLLGKRDESDQPSERLHYRLSNDRTQALVQGTFDTDDLDPADKARLAKYVSNALAGKYTPTQCATALANKVAVFSAGKVRALGEDEVRRYLAANSAAWEPAEEKPAEPDVKPPPKARRR